MFHPDQSSSFSSPPQILGGILFAMCGGNKLTDRAPQNMQSTNFGVFLCVYSGLGFVWCVYAIFTYVTTFLQLLLFWMVFFLYVHERVKNGYGTCMFLVCVICTGSTAYNP